MIDFKLWLLRESGEFDRAEYNALFDRQLRALLPRVTDTRRRTALEEMAGFNWIGYILTAVRNAGFRDAREQEEKAHDVVVQLLVSPGQLFDGYDPAASGPMQARFSLSVRNAVLNLRRSRRRDHDQRAIGIGSDDGQIAVDAIPDRRRADEDDEVMQAFVAFVRREVGEDAARLLAVKMEYELSQRDVIAHPEFAALGEWRVRQMMTQIKDAAAAFARRHADEDFLHAVERLMGKTTRRSRPASEWTGWSSPWKSLLVT